MTPLSPSKKDCTTSVFGRHRKRISVSARSAALVVAVTPLSRNSPNQRSVRSLTISSAPLFRRLWAIGRPICPRPTKPSFMPDLLHLSGREKHDRLPISAKMPRQLSPPVDRVQDAVRHTSPFLCLPWKARRAGGFDHGQDVLGASHNRRIHHPAV